MKHLFVFLVLIGCGNEPTKTVYENPPQTNPPAKPTKPGGASGFAAIKPILDEQCALSGCHAGAPFLQSEAGFRASTSGARIASGSMPLQTSPNFPLWNDQKKAKILQFLND